MFNAFLLALRNFLIESLVQLPNSQHIKLLQSNEFQSHLDWLNPDFPVHAVGVQDAYLRFGKALAMIDACKIVFHDVSPYTAPEQF